MRDADTVQVMHVHVVHTLRKGAVMSIQFSNGAFAAILAVELDRPVDSLDDLIASGRPWRGRNGRHQGKQKHRSRNTCALEHDSSHRRTDSAAIIHSRWTT